MHLTRIYNRLEEALAPYALVTNLLLIALAVVPLYILFFVHSQTARVA